jgi:molybdopterin molybdotransferase
VDNVIRKGENLKKGELLLSPRILAAQDIGILASGGFADVEVVGRPRVGVVSTGDEIEAPGSALPAASIYDSNGPQLCAQASAAGALARFFGIVRDREGALSAVLSRALDESDIVLVSGGVSMGDFDLVPHVLQTLDVEAVFHSLAMRPGKPTFFGMRGKTAVFGLPGNPVSTFVNFEVLVKPCLYAMAGLDFMPSVVAARLGKTLARRGVDRVEFLPARLESGPEGMVAIPLNYHGSSMITVLADADALLRMELGQDRVEEGVIVDARRIRT